MYRGYRHPVASMLSGGTGEICLVLVRNCEVSSKKDQFSLTRGVRSFSRKTEMGEKMESVEATMGLPSGLSSLL